jgi:hypothetical protein
MSDQPIAVPNVIINAIYSSSRSIKRTLDPTGDGRALEPRQPVQQVASEPTAELPFPVPALLVNTIEATGRTIPHTFRPRL